MKHLLRGHYAYYGIAGNFRALQKVQHHVERYWRQMLSSRSRKGYMTWAVFNRLKTRYPLPHPQLALPYDGRGGRRRTTRAKDTRRGIPQGAPISPLLANLYMRRFVLGWKVLGHQRRLAAHIVNYAEDFVICCLRGRADEALAAMRAMMTRLKLAVNEDKTTLRRLPADSIDFLGYTLGRCYSTRTGRAYIGTRPSKRSVHRVVRRISELTARRMLLLDERTLVERLNRVLVGWGNYFCLGPVSPAYRAVDAHARKRLRRWLCAKHVNGGKGTSRYPDEFLHGALELVRLSARTRDLPWAKA